MRIPLSSQDRIPARGGVGLKAEHYRTIIDTAPDVGFFEVHAENYMGAGGPPHRYLSAIRERYPLSLHGVGLSIGADRPLDEDHIERLRHLRRRYSPGLFSEHLAWSSHGAGFLNDLLPVPYTAESLNRVVEHIDQVQTALGCEMLLENPSTYVAFAESTFAETDFIAEVAQRSGCGLLLDVNNVFVASTNQQWDPVAYIEGYPLASVKEIHLAGHTRQEDEETRPLLIDSHDRPVEDTVWHLYELTVRLVGSVPTLIEWDAEVPAWSTLAAEAKRAETIMSANRPERRRHAVASTHFS
jgi:uncharacterized protein (UPF0276 family)